MSSRQVLRDFAHTGEAAPRFMFLNGLHAIRSAAHETTRALDTVATVGFDPRIRSGSAARNERDAPCI